MSFIEIKDINLTYEGKVLFQGFNLSIDKGEKILISGKSGAGKSSLIKILLGFRNFDSGHVKIIDKILKDGDFGDFRTLYAYVNQDVTVRGGSVREFVETLASYKNNDFRLCEPYGLDQELMELFEFDKSLIDRDTSILSGGERQRLGIIIAIMLNKPVYLLDEVTSALDGDLKKKVAEYFANCKETVISISHDQVWEDTGIFRKVVW